MWEYAMGMILHIMNHLPDEADGSLYSDKFLWVMQKPNTNIFHTIGCSVYVLIPEAESAKAKTWDARSRVGVYFGSFQMHAGCHQSLVCTQK